MIKNSSDTKYFTMLKTLSGFYITNYKSFLQETGQFFQKKLVACSNDYKTIYFERTKVVQIKRIIE